MRPILLLSLTAFACTPEPPPTVRHVTIVDPMAFLAGAGTRHDWPLPAGYVALHNVAESSTTARQSWDFAPFGSYEPERGDGFQVAEIGADGFVRFTSTRDGGTTYVQHFVGQFCGGTGWVVFGTDAPTGSWGEVVAQLNIAQDPATCPPSLNPAYTRYRLEPVSYQFATDGVIEQRTIGTVISEHYNGRSIAAAVSLERSYLGKGYGLLRWEAWGPELPLVDLSDRCGPVAYSVAPVDGWYMQDCRTYSNVGTRATP